MEGYPVSALLTVFESFEGELAAGAIETPRLGEKVLGHYQITLIGYDVDTVDFIAFDPFDGSRFTIPFDYILNSGLACDFVVLV